ncbi:MAG: alcohol dehydrogenase catalytic domain-containing protein, partial [Euryarchaeota archaeon]|nr:alcohol dehydrogenase catalytic domain-containing protein [Euryarchaeota archaeon]
MKTRAAVLHKPRQLTVEEVELDPPRRHEVLVKIAAVGVCASDHHRYTGDAPHPLPCVLGHEGAGFVQETGEGVEGLKPGDPVVLTVLPTCGTCARCTQGEPYHCPRGWQTIASGKLLDNTRRLKRPGGGILNHFLGQSSMAEHAVVHERTAVKIPPDIPMEKAALLGCGATTGFGAVFHAPGFKPGCTVAIFGCGGVGTSALLAAKAGGASTIIAVDLQEEKLQQARALGATHTLNPTQGSPVQKIIDLTGGGVDVALEFVGNPKVMEQALRSTRMGGAT